MITDRWRVRLDVPAETRHLHIVRLTTAAAAAEAGLDAEEVEDVKIAVDELCSIAMAATTATDEVLSLEFVAVDGELRIEATIPSAEGMELDDMARAILGATVDTFAFGGGGRGGFQLTKSRRVP